MKQQGAGDVVGQVAHYPQVLSQCGKINFQRIGLNDCKLLRGVLIAQTSRQIAVDFDNSKVIERLQQRHRKRRQARADLDEVIARLRINGPHNGLNDAFVDQKVLAETLASLMRHDQRRAFWLWRGSRRLSI